MPKAWLCFCGTIHKGPSSLCSRTPLLSPSPVKTQCSLIYFHASLKKQETHYSICQYIQQIFVLYNVMASLNALRLCGLERWPGLVLGK